MKLIFENWRKHLKEGLLTEFDKADRNSVMGDADRFTVSYEIELETDENIGGEDGGGIDLERARNYIGEDYFYESTNEREAGDFFEYTISVEPREDEFVAWYLSQIEEAETPNYIDSVLLGLAAETSDVHKKELLGILKELFDPNTRVHKKAAKVIADNFTEEELVRYKVGKPKRIGQQGTLGLDGESGVEEIVEVDVAAFVKQLLFDYDNIGKGGTLPQYPKADYGFQGFMDDIGLTDEIADVIEAGRDYLEEEISTGGGERWATLSDLTNTYQYKTPIARDIAVQVSNAVEADIEKTVEEQYQEYQEDPIDYLENMGIEMDQFEREDEEGDPRELLTQAFPNFMAEYEDQLKFERDASLANGIEFSMDDPVYMTGLDEAFKFLDLFFEDYDNQSIFRFDTNTGLHTNIGYLDKDGDEITDYNLIKTMLFLNNDFAFKGFENRKGSRWAGDLKAIFKREIEDQLGGPAKSTYGFNEWKDSIFDLYKEGKFDELEKKLSSLVRSFAPSNPKSIGFNLHYIGNRGYVEFRYPGGDSPTLEKMKNTTLYYAHLIKLAVDKDYKRKEFLKKLVKLMVNLKDIRKRKVNIKETFAGMKKGKLYRIPVDYDENGLYNLIKTTEDLPEEFQTLSLFIRRNAAPGVFKGLRKKDGKMFPVFEIIGSAVDGGEMKEKVFSLDDFAFFKKSGSIEGMGKTSSNTKAYKYFRNKIEG